MSRLTTTLLFALILSTTVTSSVSAQDREIELLASKDNTLIEQNSGALSNGAGSFLFFGLTSQTQGPTRRAVIAFDVAADIPAGAVIQSAVLRVTVNKTISGAANATVHRVLQDWGEGASNAAGDEGSGTASTEDDATWVHSFFNTEEWQTLGGNYDPATLTLASAGGLGDVDFPSSAQFVEAVQSWLDTPDQNFGLIILGDENTSPSAKRIGSKEGSPSDQPRLIVTYSIPTATDDIELPSFLTSLRTYPNPTSSLATVNYELGDSRQVRIDLVDVTGRVVSTPLSRVAPAGSHTLQLDTSDLTPGLYLVRLSSGVESAARTLVVQ